MNKTIKKMISFAMATLMLVQLTGCGKKDEQGDGKFTMTLWTKMTQDATEEQIKYHDQWFQKLQEKFPEVEFIETIPPAGSDYRQEYDKNLLAGTAPTFTTIFSYTDIPTRIENGTIADITKYVEDWDLKKDGKIITVFDEAISKDGKWYALPHKAYTEASLINKKLLRDAGYDETKLPETWDEFAQMGVQITDFNIPRIGYALLGMDWCAWPYTAWVWSAGGEMVRKNDDGTYKLAFNEPEGVDAAMFLNELIWKYKMTQKDVLMSRADLADLVYNQTACYSWNNFSGFNSTLLETYNLDITDFCEDMMPVKDKSIDRPALAGGEVVTFNPKLSEDALAKAVEVAQYLYFSDDMMQLACDNIRDNKQMDTFVPGRSDWYEKKLEANVLLTDSMREDLIKLEQHAKAEPFCEHWSEIKSQLVAPLQEIFLTEGITREQAQKLLDKCADELYQLYPDSFKK